MARSTRVQQRRRALRGGTPQERLLAAATEIFTLRGYAGTSVRAVVERAGVTKPVLYYHFGSKEGIYRALAGQIVADYEARLAAASRTPGRVVARVTAVCNDLFAFTQERLESVRFFYGVFYGPVQSAPPFDFHVFAQRLRATLRAMLAEGASRGEVRPEAIDDLVTGIEAMLNFGVEAALAEPERNFSARDLTRLVTLLIRGAAPGRAVRRSPSPRITRKEIHA